MAEQSSLDWHRLPVTQRETADLEHELESLSNDYYEELALGTNSEEPRMQRRALRMRLISRELRYRNGR